MFECEFSIGDGWADLVRANVEMRIAAGQHWRFIQIKERYGGLRHYDVGD